MITFVSSLLPVSLYTQETLIFIDETGTNGTDANWKFGYSLGGRPVRAQKLVVRENKCQL